MSSIGGASLTPLCAAKAGAARCCKVLQGAARCCKVPQGAARCCKVLGGAAMCCKVPQRAAEGGRGRAARSRTCLFLFCDVAVFNLFLSVSFSVIRCFY